MLDAVLGIKFLKVVLYFHRIKAFLLGIPFVTCSVLRFLTVVFNFCSVFLHIHIIHV